MSTIWPTCTSPWNSGFENSSSTRCGHPRWALGFWICVPLVLGVLAWVLSFKLKRISGQTHREQLTFEDIEVSSEAQETCKKKDEEKMELMRSLDVPLIRTEEILKTKIGGGFYGTCYRVQFPDVKESLIMKTYRWDHFKGFGWKGMFWEAEALKKVKSVQGTPNLIAVDPFSRRCALIMTDCGTTSFQSWVKKNAGDVQKQVTLLMKLSKTLEEIHAVGISHNDLHSGNIVIDESTDQPSIVDFGGSIPFGQRSWRTLFLPYVPFLQLVGIKPISAFVDIRNFERILRFAEKHVGLEGPAKAAYGDLRMDCKKNCIKSAEELHKRMQAIAVMMEGDQTTMD